MSKDTVDIRGKDYKLIAARLKEFLDDSKREYVIHTEVLKADTTEALVKASVIHVPTGTVCSTGHAHEIQGSTNVNKTSWVENCETSAIGRCIGMFDSKYTGDSIASADEVANAIKQQNMTDWLEYMELLRENYDWVTYAKEAIANEDWQTLAAIWTDIDHETMAKLFLAPTKGGIFTTEERAACKGNNAFNQARKELANV